MIKLLPITALHYDPPINPNELDVYIEINDETAKELSSPGCDGLNFADVTGLSSRILHQKPTQPRSLPISIERGIGEQRGKINVGYLL